MSIADTTSKSLNVFVGWKRESKWLVIAECTMENWYEEHKGRYETGIEIERNIILS